MSDCEKNFLQPPVNGSAFANLAFADCRGRRKKMEDVATVFVCESGDRTVRVAALFDGHNSDDKKPAASTFCIGYVKENAHALINSTAETIAHFFQGLQQHIAALIQKDLKEKRNERVKQSYFYTCIEL